MASQTCRALVIKEKEGRNILVVENIHVPQPGPRQALVKVAVAAQNPTDVLCFDDGVFGKGTVLGCDFSGTVSAVGSEVTRIQKGDKIAGLIWGGQIKGQGAYSEYTIADENLCYKIPDGVSVEDAVTIPLAATTAWMAFFRSQSLHIDRTRGSAVQILIWAGSTSVGLYAVQLAVHFGFRVATVCSPRHFPLLLSLGANYVFDYKDSDVISKIQQALPDLEHVFDTIGNETSSITASKAIRAYGGTLCTVRPFKEHTEAVTPQTKVTSILVFTAFLRDQQMGAKFLPASKEDHELASEFFESLPQLLLQGKIRPNKPELIEGGLQAVEKGFQAYRDGKISGHKIVYRLS